MASRKALRDLEKLLVELNWTDDDVDWLIGKIGGINGRRGITPPSQKKDYAKLGFPGKLNHGI